MDFKLPDLGEGIHEAQIISVLVKEGDSVNEDDPLMEVETDKAAVEIPSPHSGKITKMHVSQGQTVNVGDVLVTFDGAGGAKEDKAEAKGEKEDKSKREPRREKAENREEERPQRERPSKDRDERREPREEERRGGEERDRSRPVPASPAVRRMAREMNIDLHDVRGSGPGGRVLESDVKAFADNGGTAVQTRREAPSRDRDDVAPLTELPAVDTSLPDFSKWGPIRREAVPQIRKTIARQMTRAWLSVPRVTHSDSADVTDLEAMRKSFSAELEKRGAGKLTLTGVLVKALGVALRKYPMLNASFDAQTNEIIYKDYVNIGIAVDTKRGLVVPVVRDVDSKSLAQISADLADVGQRAREMKFGVEDLRGATFTLSNVGALGGAFVTPMVNFPEAAILGVGRSGWQAWIHNDEIAKRFIMPLSLSFDHRIIDGADAARFTKELIGYLENPLRLLSEL